MTNLIGQSLGRYHILEQLGEGGMATVYKAHDPNLNRDVAVKIIRSEIFGPAALDHLLVRFKREAQSLARLTHPNIVTILDYGEFQGEPYLVMPYLPGGTLKSRIKKPIPYQEAARLLIPIAQAMIHAHQQGIIHRDIKPANILITSTGESMLSDFGIAKLLDTEETRELTGSGFGIGTPAYMAPEQGIGQADERADIYALGTVFYELVTGRVPYRADTPMAILIKKREEPLPHPRKFVPDLPDAVANVLIKVLARDPRNRYQTALEFLKALKHLESSVQKRSLVPWISFGVVGIGLGIAGIILTVALVGLGSRQVVVEVSPINKEVSTSTFAAQTSVVTASPVFTITPEISIILPVETLQPQFDSENPDGFLNWWFHVIWSERNYEELWDYISPEFSGRLNTNYSTFVDNWKKIGNIEEPITVTFIRADGQIKVYNVKYTTLSLIGSFPDHRNDNFYLYFNPTKGHWEFK